MKADRRSTILSVNPAMLSALAALGGSAVGVLVPVLSNVILLRGRIQRDLLNRQIPQQEKLYSDFINEASRIYARSITSNLETLDELVSLYALVSRMRLMASESVVQAAETFVKQVVLHYGEPNLTVEEMRAAALAAKADPLDIFSFACRKELRNILRRGELSAAMRN
jgi:hypothetical protein